MQRGLSEPEAASSYRVEQVAQPDELCECTVDSQLHPLLSPGFQQSTRSEPEWGRRGDAVKVPADTRGPFFGVSPCGSSSEECFINVDKKTVRKCNSPQNLGL